MLGHEPLRLTVRRLTQKVMDIRRPYEPTADQLALTQARQEKKRQAEALRAKVQTPTTSLLERPWLNIFERSENANSQSVKILTWNILAQCLVRRTLFPTSDCLKAAQRHKLIQEELQRQNSDIICLQEVDQLEKLTPMLDKSGYSHHYASGRNKKHGCLIGYKKELYSFLADKVIYYDEQSVETTGEQNRLGSSFKTKNIGYMVAIQSRRNTNEGIVVATTHLFWHPKYTYERIRQTAILAQELVKFRESLPNKTWPCVLAGDFNFGPGDPGYSLLTGEALLPYQEAMILPSRVVHSSVDPTMLQQLISNPTTSESAKEDEEGTAVDPDRVITNARPAVNSDGLLTTAELVECFTALPAFRSVYADGLQEIRKEGGLVANYRGGNVTLSDDRHGVHEPEYTSYTHYWQAVLDYIFVLEQPQKPMQIAGLLAPLTADAMEPGLPQKNVSGSDHLCLVAVLKL